MSTEAGGLRARSEGGRSSGPAPLHRITRSACANALGGIVRPMAWARRRSITNSNELRRLLHRQLARGRAVEDLGDVLRDLAQDGGDLGSVRQHGAVARVGARPAAAARHEGEQRGRRATLIWEALIRSASGRSRRKVALAASKSSAASTSTGSQRTPSARAAASCSAYYRGRGRGAPSRHQRAAPAAGEGDQPGCGHHKLEQPDLLRRQPRRGSTSRQLAAGPGQVAMRPARTGSGMNAVTIGAGCDSPPSPPAPPRRW